MEHQEIERYLKALGGTYSDLKGPPLTLGICGGAALSVTGLIPRATKDIDLLFPLDLPEPFWIACKQVAAEFGLPPNWINQGPKDLMIFGLPSGFEDRAIRKQYSPQLICLFASRYDQLHFKLYASVDRGGYHVEDLLKLKPTSDEIQQAPEWCRTHDPSDGFFQILKSMLTQLGFNDVAEKL